MKRRALALLLLLVLLLHWAALSWLRQQVPGVKPLQPMAAPLLTRTLQAQTPPPAPARAAKTPARPKTAPALAQAEPDGDASAQVTAEAPELPASAPQQEAASEPDELAPPPAVEASAAASSDAPAATDAWPPDTRLSYALTGNYRGPLYGSARVQWQRENSRYQVRLDLQLALVVRVFMTSQGEVSDSGLRPSVYEEQFPTSLQRVLFDAGYVRFANGSQLPQPPALQDTVSQFVELSHRFSSGRDVLKVGGEVLVWLARPQGMALWTYDVLDEEILHIAGVGAVPTFHLRPRSIANPHGVMTAELWFAPSLQYLPVRVRIALGGDNFVDLLVERIEQGAAPAPLSP